MVCESATTSGTVTFGSAARALPLLAIASGTFAYNATSGTVAVTGALPLKTWVVVSDTSGTAGSSCKWAPFIGKAETGAVDIITTSKTLNGRAWNAMIFNTP